MRIPSGRNQTRHPCARFGACQAPSTPGSGGFFCHEMSYSEAAIWASTRDNQPAGIDEPGRAVGTVPSAATRCVIPAAATSASATAIPRPDDDARHERDAPNAPRGSNALLFMGSP